jgi:competence protein ComEC
VRTKDASTFCRHTLNAIAIFWEKNPALFYGLILLSGSLFVLQSPWALLIFATLLHKKRFFLAALLFFLPCYMVYQLYTFPPSGRVVEGVFYMQGIKKNERFGGAGWSYSGILKTKEGRIACRCYSKNYFPPNGAYKIKGALRPLKGKFYSLKTQGPWEWVNHRWTLVAYRSKAQEFLKHYIEKHIAQKRAAQFLIGMITGQLEDRVMMQEFSDLGLSHLMAISGLHFSLLALFFHLFLRLFLPYKFEALCLMFLLSFYLLFIGETPSILRAWIVVMVFLLGQLLEKRSSALNSLGIALCCSLIWNPLSATTLSFQLSFLATAGILFFYSPFNRLLELWLPKRALKDVIAKHWMWQHGYIILSFFREALALTLAVHVAILPLLLQAFHFFSLNGLFYNLFFPFLASAALLFFIASIPLGHWAHVANGHYCDLILRLTDSPPLLFKSFYVEGLPPWLFVSLLTLLLAAAIGSKIKESANGFCIADDPLFDHL